MSINFETKFGSTLVSKTGEVSTSTALEGKDIIGIYFSAHWCPPCRGFTPTLGQKYTELKDAGKDIEIVFVSSDRDENAMTKYHKSMPFLALPFSATPFNRALNKECGVNGIPTLVLLDGKTGKILTKKGRDAFSSQDIVAKWPFDSYRPLFDKDAHIIEKLGASLKSKTGTVDTKTALSGKDAIGLYFSAHWCPPCRRFTPILCQKYTELKNAGKSIEVVFVSSDKSESSFNDYYDAMPFLALPYDQRSRKEQLSDHFEVRGIPTLIILDGKTGEIINTEGTSALASENVIDAFPFHPPAMCDLSESTNGINEHSALVVVMDKASEEAQETASTILMSIATEEKKKPEESRRTKVFFTGRQEGIVSQIRACCKIPDDATAPTMIILDLASQGAFYTPADANSTVSEENIQAFMNDFQAGSLPRQQWTRPS